MVMFRPTSNGCSVPTAFKASRILITAVIAVTAFVAPSVIAPGDP